MLATGNLYPGNNLIPKKKKKKASQSQAALPHHLSQSPSQTSIIKGPKDTESLRRDVQAQLQQLRNQDNQNSFSQQALEHQPDVNQLTQSMNADRIRQLYTQQQALMDNSSSPRRQQRRRSRQVATVVNTNGPVALLGINRDALSQSHRNVNKKVRNTRDVLKVGEVNENKFEQYQSPALSKIRVTSAVGKRNLNQLKDRQNSHGPSKFQSEGFDPVGRESSPHHSRDGKQSAMTTIHKQNSSVRQQSSTGGIQPLKFSKDQTGKSRIVNTESLTVGLRIDENTAMAIAPRSGAVTSMHIPTSMGGKRRVHTEGLKMLENHYQMSEEKMKMQSMENRIRRLEFEEQRARKMEKLANERAGNMIDARKRHFEDLLLKKNYYLNMQLQENKQREANLKRRADNQQNIQMRRYEAMSQNREKKEKLRMDISFDKSKGEALRLEQLEKQKIQKLKDLIAKNKAKQSYEIQVNDRKIEVGSAYHLRQQKEESEAEAYKKRIAQLEEREMRLVDQLKDTTNRQRSAYRNLEQVVSQGYDYYFQSFSEKRQIQEKRAKAQSIIDEAKYRSLDVSQPVPEEGRLHQSLDVSTISEVAPQGTKLRQLQTQASPVAKLSSPGLVQPYADELQSADRTQLKAQASMDLIMGRRQQQRKKLRR